MKRVAVVTGASRGIGLAVATGLHQDGFDLLTCSRSELDHPADRWAHLAADLGTPEGIAALVDHPLTEHATVLVNNVGHIRAVGGIAAESAEAVRATFETNVFGPVEVSRCVAPKIAALGGGLIVNLSSIYGPVSPAPAVLSYAASKAAVAAVTQSLALELAGQGVRVNAILPGNIDTDMTRGGGDEYVGQVVERTPLGRLGDTDDITKAVRFLVDADFITGHLLVVDGGISLVGG